MNNAETFLKIFNGATTKYGYCYQHNPVTEEKLTTEKTGMIPIEDHLNGKKLCGRSPLIEETNEVEWIGIDIDKKIKPSVFCPTIWKLLGWMYFPFQTPNKKWRLIEFLDEPMDVEEASERAKELEARIEKELLIKCDGNATVPTVPGEPGKVGRWLYLPYHYEHDKLYSPDGRPLSLEQFFFRHKYRKHLPVVASVGALSGAEGGGRNKAFLTVQLYKTLYDCDVTLEELNKVLDEPIKEDDPKLRNYIKGVEKSVAKGKMDEQWYLNAQRKWIKEICQVEPCLDAKGFSAITDSVLNNHYYVQSRTDFYEVETQTFKSKEQINDWWRHEVKKGSMSDQLLKDTKLTKLRSYFTHAGFDPGIAHINNGDIKGLPAGTYLNIYEDPQIEAIQGNIDRLNEYYSWLLGEDNWNIIKQVLAFMLNAKTERLHYGIKIQWYVIIHSVVEGVGKKLFSLICQSLFGPKNVSPNVKFSQMIGTHSTIVEGKQLIFLNEVVLQKNTAKTKELSNEFKDLITEDNLVINPKNKPQIEIPNLCNFFVFSNSKTPIHIGEYDRRSFVIHIKRPKDQVVQMLQNENYKKDILETIKNPSHFKWHLLNEVTYDREMFFRDAPTTADKELLIEANKDDFYVMMEDAFDNEEFPFAPHNEIKEFSDSLYWHYNGTIHKVDCFRAMKKSELFKNVYFTMADLENFLKEKATKWPNGELTKQAKNSKDGRKKRLYLMHIKEVRDGLYNSDLSETELWVAHGYKDPNKKFEDIC
jgi:hypothetical protein